MRRRLPWLLSLLALSAQTREGVAEDPERIQEGQPLVVRFEEGSPLRVFRFQCRADATALHLRVSGSEDIDLYVADRILDVESLHEAPHAAEGVHTSDRLHLLPEKGTTFGEAKVWLVHVYAVSMSDVPLEAELFLWEDRPGHRLLGAGTTVLFPEAGASGTGGYCLVSRYELGAVVRAESAEGIPRLLVSQEAIEIEGVPRGQGSEVTMRHARHLTTGVWRVEVEAPKGAADRRVGVEVLPLQTPVVGSSTLPLGTSEGEADLEDEDTEYTAYLDVEEGTASFEVHATMQEAAFRISVNTIPPDGITPCRWVCRAGGTTKRLFVGGDGFLPTGRYWVTVLKEFEGSSPVHLTWKRFAEPPPGATAPRAPLRSSVPAPLHFPAGADRVSFALEGVPDAAAQFQIFGSSLNLDLALVRCDTGAILHAARTFRCDERLGLDDSFLVPDGVALRIEALRTNAEHAAEGGEIRYRHDGRPEPPEGFLPPYACWSADAWHRALAASVVLRTADGGGSAVVVSPRGLLLTSAHVIDGGEEIVVAFPFTRKGAVHESFSAEVVERDADLDLALLRMTTDAGGRPLADAARLPFAPLGRAEDLELGSALRVLGYPDSSTFDLETNLTVLQGVASAFERDAKGLRWIVTDARTSFGNSGGGAFDEHRALVGIITNGVIGESLGFARPVDSLPRSWRERILADGGEAR